MASEDVFDCKNEAAQVDAEADYSHIKETSALAHVDPYKDSLGYSYGYQFDVYSLEVLCLEIFKRHKAESANK